MSIIKKKSKLLLKLILAVVVLTAAFKGYNLFHNNQILSSLEGTQDISFESIEKDRTLSDVNKLFELPESTGIFGKIKDIQFLQNQKSYFNKAKEGDILIIYNDLTIIYDPQTKTIVDIAKEKLLK